MTAYVYSSGGFPTSPVTNDTLVINNAIYDWTGTIWQSRSTNATATRVDFIATAGQATKTGLTYTVGNIDCFLNGSKMTLGTDFTATDGVSVTFTPALTLNDEVQLIMDASASGSGASSAGTTIVANFDGLIALTGMTAGSQAYVTETNKLYFYTGVGWYLIATVQNDAPSAITGVNGSYSLAIDGTATTITAVSTDPEGFPLTWTYTASGLGSIATVSQADNVFTVTPSTAEANAGSFTLTISATDGINGAVSTIPSFSLFFAVPNSKYTTLLAKAVSTGDNNNITDASSNNHTITVSGDPYAGTFSPYRHGGYSTHFDGAGDYLNASANTAFEFGTGDFNIELFFNRQTSGSADALIQYGDATVSGYIQNSWSLYISSSNYLSFEMSDGTAGGAGILSLLSNVLFPTNSWVHVSVVRDGNNFTLYQNGNAVATTTDNRSAYVSPSPLLWIARNHSGGSADTAGWFSNVRIVKGTAVYTTNFTPSTESLTAITNTSLLTCHLPYIVDGSTNAHAITVNGNVSITPFSMDDYLPYSAGTNGGSVYLNGTTDYLQSAANSDFQFGTSDFTVEVWVYFEALPSESLLLTKWNAGGQAGTNQWLLFMVDSTPYFIWSTDGLARSGTGVTGPNLALNSWHHLAAVRNGSSITLYVNGVPGTSESESGSLYGSETELLGIGYRRDNNSGTSRLTGYMSDIRIVKGTAVYTAAFTPPTAPLSSSGSSLHIKGTDASIIDKSQVSNVKLVGNTTASTTQIKYGNSSIYFDGVGDYAFIENGFPDAAADFTVEFWVNPSNVSNNKTSFYDARDGQPNSPIVWQDNAGIYLYAGADRIVISSGLSAGTWAHVSLVRSSGVYKLYLNGTASGTTYANTDALVVKDLYIGARFSADGAYYDGYMDDFRISKTARYTANFTPSQLGELQG